MWLRYGYGFAYINLIRPIILCLTLLRIVLSFIFKNSFQIARQWLFDSGLILICIISSRMNTAGSIWMTSYVLLLVCFLTLSYSLTTQEIKQLFRRYINIMVTIAIVSLFFFIFGSLLHIIAPSGYVNFD